MFHIVVAGIIAARHELSERNVDFLVRPRYAQFTKEVFDFEFLYDASHAVVAGAQNPWARRRKIGLAELVNEPWLLPAPESEIGSIYAKVFHASGLDYPRATVIALPLDVRMVLISTGRFLTMVLVSPLNFPLKRPDIKVLPVALQLARVPIGIVIVKGRTLSPVGQLYIEHAREVAKTMTRK